MDKFDENILPFLENNNINYLADGNIKSMSVEYFQKSFTSMAVREQSHKGQSYFCYQNKENPEIVMCFRISQLAGLSATIMGYSDFQTQFSAPSNL